MRALLLASVCTGIAMGAVSALEVVVRPSVQCDAGSQRWDVSNASLLNTAFLWTQGMSIRNWSYTPLTTLSEQAPEDECVHVEYDTFVQIPRFFLLYAEDSRHPVHISKTMCTGNAQQEMRETVLVRNIPFIESMTFKIEGGFRERGTKLKADWDLHVPWYLELLRAEIDQHINSSLQEYLQLLAGTTCAQSLKNFKQRKMRGIYKVSDLLKRSSRRYSR